MLKQLTENADRSSAPGAANRKENVADFFVQSRIAGAGDGREAQATSSATFRSSRAFLRELRPFMDRFAALSQAMEPVVSDLRASGPDLSRFLIALGPVLAQLDGGAQESRRHRRRRAARARRRPAGRQAARRVHGSQARPVIRNLRLLLTEHRRSTRGSSASWTCSSTTRSATNGFDEVGHYLRNNLIVTICSGYAITPTIGCSANFQSAGSSSASSAATLERVGLDGRAAARQDDLRRRRRRPARARPPSSRARARPTAARRERRLRRREPHEPRPQAQSPSRPAPERPPGDPAAERRATRCSITCSEATSEPPAHRCHRDRLQPRAGRRRDDARDRGRGLPRLQRERRAAVGALLQADRRGAERRQPGARQRGAHRRPARRA